MEAFEILSVCLDMVKTMLVDRCVAEIWVVVVVVVVVILHIIVEEVVAVEVEVLVEVIAVVHHGLHGTRQDVRRVIY